MTVANTYNTQNPLGSSDPRDAYDNSSNFDEFSNSTAPFFTNRFGAGRRTITGITQAVVNYVNRGEWTATTDYNVNEIWRDGPTGAFYLVLADYTSGASAAADIASGNVTVQQPKDWVASVNTWADLETTFEPAFDGQKINLLGYSIKGTGGGQMYADFSDTTTPNDGATVAVTAGGKRIKRVIKGFVTPEMAGATGGGLVDESSEIDSAILERQKNEVLVSLKHNVGAGISTDDDNVIISGVGGGEFTSAGVDIRLVYCLDPTGLTQPTGFKVKNLTLNRTSEVADSSDNFANVQSWANKTSLLFNNIDYGRVGLSFQKNYAAVQELATVKEALCIGNYISTDYLGVEHFGSKKVVTAANVLKGVDGPSGGTFGGMRYVGDEINVISEASYNICIGNIIDGYDNGLTTQKNVVKNLFTNNVILNTTKGISIPQNVIDPSDHNQLNYYQAGIFDSTRAVDAYNPNYCVFDIIAGDISGEAFTFRTTPGFGENKSNTVRFSGKQAGTVGDFSISNSKIEIQASDLQNNGVIVSGDNNHVIAVIDKANIANSGSLSMSVTGSNNIIDVIATGNINTFNDVTISGSYNICRVNTDGVLRVPGNSNIVDGYASQLFNTGTDNDVARVKIR